MRLVYSEMLDELFSEYEGPNKELLQNVPRFFRLLQRIYVSDGLSWKYKFIINGCLSYFAVPGDIIPDDEVERGYIDDLFICSWTLWYLLDDIPDVVTENWRGEEDIELLVEKTLETTADMLGGLDRYVLGLVGMLKFSSMLERGRLDYDGSVDKEKRAIVEDQVYSLKGLLSVVYTFMGHEMDERTPVTKMKSLYSDAQWDLVARILENLKSAEEVYDNSHEEELEKIHRDVLINMDNSIYM